MFMTNENLDKQRKPQKSFDIKKTFCFVCCFMKRRSEEIKNVSGIGRINVYESKQL